VLHDSHWNRIAARPPAFQIVAIGERQSSRSQVLSLSQIGSSIRVLRNGSEVSLTPTSDTPVGYSAHTPNGGHEFLANSGDRIHLDARLDASNLPEGSALRVFPSWSALREDEDFGIGHFVSHTVALAAGIAGLVCLLAAGALGWGRPEPPNPRWSRRR